MDELQGEKKDPAQDSVAELLFSSACVDHFETIDSPQPIVNGLQLIEKSAGSQKPFKSFSYATSPVTKEPVTVEKTLIWHRAYSIQSEHVRCHVLTPDDNIPELIIKYSRQHAQAVVLINTANNYTLISHSLLCDAASSDIPVLVVTSQDGEELLSILNEFKPGDVLVQILRKDSDFSTTFHRGTLLPVKASSRSQLSKGVLFNPWKEFKLYTFPKEGPLCVCKDILQFQLVMYTFNQLEYEAKSQHEVQGKQLSENLLKRMNKKLEKYKNNPVAFEENFPLYVLLIIHMHRRRDVYQCGDLEKFIETVLERMELLPVKRIAEVLNGFLEQDFKIVKGDECVSIFHSLYEACEGILVLQFVKKHKRNIYCWILWINILLRCCQCDVSVSSDEVPKTAERLWNNYILKESSSITLKKETIKQIGKGMKLGVLLLLPDELQFNASRLSSLLFPRNLIRPLQHVRNFVFETLQSKEQTLQHKEQTLQNKEQTLQNKEQLLQNEEQFVSSFVRTSREHYACLFSAHDSALKSTEASVDHTVQGFVREGVDFLDTVWVVSLQRQWKSNSLKEECRRWFSLLLKAVEIKKGVESILGMFLTSKKAVTWVAEFRPSIESEIIKKTREMFGKMDISVFYPMYKAFIIWSNEFLSEYLKSYASSNCDLKDAHWTLLLKEVVQRFPEPNKHGFILDFLFSKAAIYAKLKQPVKYILEVMELDVPNLFTDSKSGTGGISVPGKNFKELLHSYIASNGLQRELLKKVDVIMNGIHQHHHGFQDIILSVLEEDIIPDLQTSAEERQLVLKPLHVVVGFLSKDVCPKGSLTRKQKFCWGVLATLCEQIQPKENCFHWAEVFTAIIEKMGEIYGQYCHSKHGTKECTLEKQLKPDIRECPPEVQVYYLWIQKIHMILFSWQSMFLHQTVNFDDMINYAINNTAIYVAAKAVCATQLIVDDQHISDLKTTYLQDFEELNFLLLKYVPEIPRAKWRTLMSILRMYRVSLPETHQELIEQFVALPGENIDSKKLTLQRHPLPPNITGKFKPPQPISLRLSEQLTWKELAMLLQELKEFLKPLDDCMDVLVFFALHDSHLFSAYLRHEMETRDADLNADLTVFVQAFNQVMSLLVKLCHGEPNYDEITANGAVDLENLDIESEHSILLTSIQFRKLPDISNTQGLDGVRNMVDLLKVSNHIRMLRQVCQQYHLKTCLDDENLKKLTLIADKLMDEGARATLTPLSATRTMGTVRELLKNNEEIETCDYEYLAVFSKIADSAEFYQFICEKGFTGDNGQARFHQQYELITAQLQHEEYDEAVLNFLYTAYKLILPFTIEDQSFHSLLDSLKQMLTSSSSVGTAKKISDHLKKIETVNRNIHLVRLWFARAEGDTIQNVANDLERVLETGCYSFNIPENVADLGELQLRYKPSSKRTPPEPPNEEKSLVVFDEEETWDSEQIDGFARKLGFLDSKKADGEMVQSFLHVNEIANKILDFLVQLRELGYPSHLTDVTRNGLKCNDEEADQIVKEMEDKMDGWSQYLDRLLLEHHWLLLFNLPKLLKLSKLLISAFQPDFHAKKIMDELGFLFRSDVKDRKQVMGCIKDSLRTLQSGRCRFDQNEANIPFRVCGLFLDALFEHPEQTVYSPRKHSDESCLTHSTHTHQPTLCPTHSMEILHCAPEFSQGELISVIVEIYSGRLPHPFEFFRCQENSTMHQLKLFITRANRHPLTFVILGVNFLPVRLQEMLLRQHVNFHSSSDHEFQPCIHYVETFPSILQEMPWINHQKHKLSDVMKFKDVQKICHQQAVVERGIARIQLVYGAAGIGKTYYIRKQLANCRSVTVAVNESFKPIKAIQRLCVLPRDEKNCAIFFNFNLIPPVGDSVCKEDKINYDTLMETISWFFFDLLFLGYVEDPHSGESFQLSGGLSWSIYVEVPSRNQSSNAGIFLEEFRSEIPIFKLLGTPKMVESTAQYSDVSDPDVQLVCKYLKAYDMEIGGMKRINTLYKEDKKKKKSTPVKFSTEADLSSKECEHLLKKYVPASIRQVKTSQLLFLRYMRRRCWFLDNLPAYNYNTGVGEMNGGKATDTRHLGSTLFHAMLEEAKQFCEPCYNEDQHICQHQDREYHQLIYDVQDGGGSIGLISTAPQNVTHLERVGVHIPTMLELHKREFLDKCLSRALNIPLDGKQLTAIDEENYVLTLDFTIKMLQIHERCECGEPVILQGETGVGKTALIQMLSKLWNVSLDKELKRLKERVFEFLHSKLKCGSAMAKDQYETWLQAINSIISGENKSIEEEDLMFIAILPFHNSSGYLHQEMKKYLKMIVGDPLLPLLKIAYQHLEEAIADTRDLADFPEQHAKPVVKAFHSLLTATVRSTFHKLNVHAAMKPDDLAKELQSVFEQADQLQEASKGISTGFHNIPHVTIFLDELNASTCGGLFKELIVDRMFQGEPIPKNIFIIAACNPHRGNSLAALTVANAGRLRVINDYSADTWIMDSYFVQKLHPTLAHLMWDYGSLDEGQEEQYILSKVDMFCNHLSETQKLFKDEQSETHKPKDQSSEAQNLKENEQSEIHKPKDQSSEAQKLKENEQSETHKPKDQSSEAQKLKENEQSETHKPKDQSSEAQKLKENEQSETHKPKDQSSEAQKLKENEQSETHKPKDQSSEAQKVKENEQSEIHKPKGDQSSEAQNLKEIEQSETRKLKGDHSSEVQKPKQSETQKTKTVIEKAMVTDMIVFSQKLMRKYVFEELSMKLAEHEAKVSSKCCVSQRDIQRVFTFYEWTMKLYWKFNPHNDPDDFTSSLRAILVALGTVYYMRLNRKYRTQYQNDFAHQFSTVLQFSDAFQSELDWYTQQIELPKGIAKTQALKENMFAVIICTVTQTPLIIVGAPGSSKTLSFNVAVSNLRGQESKNKIFRKTDVFCSLDPHFYQCSRRTTSNEIHTVFSRAITRQENIAQFSLPIKCVVFMDEAGLPEHSHESLKILHSYLDDLKVSFVAISNTVLDAAKTNRAVTLFRDPMEISEDLEVLTNECLFESPGCPPHNLKEHVDTIVNLHSAYTETMTELKLSRFFGLRDFIHFVQYIRHECVQRGTNLSLYQVAQLVTVSLEKNFSGSQQFSAIHEAFLHQMDVPTSKVRRRNAVDVLKDSLRDAPTIQDEVRYKIIIHSSEDDSLVRLLFQFKILKRQNTRIYMCSDFPGDSDLQKIDTIAGIRHSAIQGHSIVMLQTDDIHESFYDLFNRRFKRIDDPVSGTRLYANIAIGAHLKPCRVDPKFQCIVAIKKTELNQTPAPFLNRFEKYFITHKNIYESVLKSLPAGFKLVVEAAYGKMEEFIHCSGGPPSFYGFCEETLDSLLLKVLPVNFTHIDVSESMYQQSHLVGNYENPQNQQIFIVQALSEACAVNFNFQSSTEEMECDAVHLMQLLLSSNPKFEGIMRTELKDMKTARKAVCSALHTLEYDHTDFTKLPPVTELIQSLLVQWLVRHFCKELMQLMTPEALVLHERQIPASYIHNYLTYQKHFSLKDLVQHQLNKISAQEVRASKLLCFTRTSPLIHNLPSVYPSTAQSTLENKSYETLLKNHLFHEVSQLVVCKVEGSQSQRSVRRMLIDFWGSAKDVMFLLVNMQEVSRNTVNHLRVIIEEEEATVTATLKPKKPKLVLLLLHFPPAMFFAACYPALFLEGWEHYYLDTIAHGLPHGIVNSVEWLHMSCFPIEQTPSTIKESFFEMLKHLLPQSIPHVVSRLSFGSDHSRPFNRPMTPLARSEMLQKLFDTELGDTLCHHFRSYWKAEVMTEYLHRAVKFTQTGQTTLNITDSIHSIIKSHFLDFLVYMVDCLNDNHNLDILLHPESTDEVIQLFQDMARCLPIPQKLSKLKLLSSIQHGSHYRKEVTRKYLFPFFGMVCSQITDAVKKVAHSLFQTEDSPERKVRRQLSFEEQVQHQVERNLKDQKGYVAVALTAISKHTTLWNRYFHDFTREQLSLWLHNQQVVKETLKATFGTVCTPSASNISQLTSLHVYAHLNQQNILKTSAAIGPLIKLSSITEQLSHFSPTSSAVILNTEDMNTFVMNVLFSALINHVKFQTSNTSVELWYNAYHAMIHSPAVRKRIYGALSATSEAKLNVMHGAFLAVQYDPGNDGLLMMCQDMVDRLCGEHFLMDSFELKGRCPQMPEMFEIITKLFDRAPRADVHDSLVSFMVDGLLTHFFCYCDKPKKNNVLWLLEHINEQKNWLMSVQVTTHGFKSHSSWKSTSSSGDSEEVQSPLLSFNSNCHCLPLNALKYYLMWILGSFREENTRQQIPPYEPEGRAILGTFLSERISNDVTGIYIPPFYKLAEVAMPENDLHSQPLAYLYFLTVFEYLLNQQSDLSGLLNLASKIYESGPDEMNEKILCSIEKQALVQIITKELAKQLVPENYKVVACKLATLNKPLNALIDEQISGENLDLHGYILAMYLLKETQSLEKFTRLLTKEFDTHCADYKCLSRFRGMIKEIHLSRTNFYHLLLQEDQSSQLWKLHQQVQKLIIEMAGKQDKYKKLNDLAKKSQRSQVSLSGSAESSDWIEKLPCIRMMIWLTVYHHMYNQQKPSTEMTNACSKLLPIYFDEPFCRLICWFASPKDQGTPGPLSELFGHTGTDATDTCLLHCLANLVACAIGTQEQAKSSHLWYLVFASEKLEGTYFAGCMNDGLVNAKRGKPYEEGVQLSKDGLSCFLQQSIRSSLNLNSRCMLLWINVASFCVSLLVQEGEGLSGILSGRVPAEKYCVFQLRNIWNFMKSNMHLIDEELSYLMMMCMRRYLQIWVASPDKMNGIFTSAGMVAQYEQLWHSDIFVPCLENLETEFTKNLKDPLKKLFVEIRKVEAHYPHFPADTAALYSVLSLPGVQTQSQDQLVLLSKFITKLPEMQITLPFLPDFIEFYQWLHKDLAGVLTPEKADKVSIKRLVDQMSRHYSGESGRKLKSLYEEVKCGYNSYMKVAGGCTGVGGFDKISVRNFLTLDASTLPGKSEGDILYSIIYEMATCHNDLLDCIPTVASRETHMNRYVPESIPSIAPTDFAEGACIVEKTGGEKLQSEFLQLVSRRHQFSTAAQKWSHQVVTNPHFLILEDLLKLQEDVVSLYLSGRPKIKNIASLHIPFAFRAAKPTTEAHPLNFEQDLNQVGKCLPPTLKSNLTEDHHVLQLLECEFHSADYHAMLDVLTGLKTAIALLEKRVKETNCDGTDIHELTLEAFMCIEGDKRQALEIFGKRLSEHQMSTVMHLPVSNLYHMFTTFIQWIVEGRYNFHMLPYALKAHLNQENVEMLKKIRALYKKGSEPKELLMELKLLADVLDHLESSLMSVGTQIPLVDYLSPMVIFEGHDEFLGLIPRTILIQHYVSLRILLKQLTEELQMDLPKPETEMERPWCELVMNFTEATAEAHETFGDYGLTHGYESDTESVKVETCSVVTQFDLAHEDELDEFHSLQPSGLTTGATSPSTEELASQTSVDPLQQAPMATSNEAKEKTDEKQLLQLARQYSSEAVGNFVTSIGLSDYAKLFEDNGLSGDALMECTDEDLEDLGIESALSRLKIMILFRRQLQGLGSLAKNFPTDKVVDFLDRLKQQEKEQYKQSFSDNQIDGEMLLAMQGKDDVMIELGVQRPIHRRIILSKFKTLIEEQGHSNT